MALPALIPPQLAGRLASARHVVALTGAGVSAASGLATFRAKQTGLWARYRPEELATPQAFRKQPDVVWEWYAWRREQVRAARPNPAHEALVRLEARVPRFTLVTQNVDGLHERAGSREVIELHGRITRTRCSSEGRYVERWTDDSRVPPRCPSCDAFLRPDVVWFGEPLPEGVLERAAEAAASSDLFLSIGTSGVVYPAASLVPVARRAGATLVSVNADPGHHAAPDAAGARAGASGPEVYHLTGDAAELLPALAECF